MRILTTIMLALFTQIVSAQWQQADWRDATHLAPRNVQKCAFADLGDYMAFYVLFDNDEYTFWTKGHDMEIVTGSLKQQSRDFTKFIADAIGNKGRYLLRSSGTRQHIWIDEDRHPMAWRYREGVGANSYFEYITNILEATIKSSSDTYYFLRTNSIQPKTEAKAIIQRVPRQNSSSDDNAAGRITLLDLMNALCPGIVTEHDKELWKLLPRSAGTSSSNNNSIGTMWDSYNSTQQAVIHEYDNAK